MTFLFTLIIIMGAVSLLLNSNDHKPTALVLIPTLLTALLSFSSCRTSKHASQTEAILSTSDSVVVLQQDLASSIAVLGNDSTLSIIDTVIEREYIDSAGVKVKEKTSIHKEKHSNYSSSQNACNGIEFFSVNKEKEDKVKIKEKETVAKSPSISPYVFLTMLALIAIIAICIRLRKCKLK